MTAAVYGPRHEALGERLRDSDTRLADVLERCTLAHPRIGYDCAPVPDLVRDSSGIGRSNWAPGLARSARGGSPLGTAAGSLLARLEHERLRRAVPLIHKPATVSALPPCLDGLGRAEAHVQATQRATHENGLARGPTGARPSWCAWKRQLGPVQLAACSVGNYPSVLHLAAWDSIDLGISHGHKAHGDRGCARGLRARSSSAKTLRILDTLVLGSTRRGLTRLTRARRHRATAARPPTQEAVHALHPLHPPRVQLPDTRIEILVPCRVNHGAHARESVRTALGRHSNAHCSDDFPSVWFGAVWVAARSRQKHDSGRIFFGPPVTAFPRRANLTRHLAPNRGAVARPARFTLGWQQPRCPGARGILRLIGGLASHERALARVCRRKSS